MRKLIYKKGLLLKVVSWENDADLYETTETYIDDLEKAKAYTYMFKTLFKSESNGENGIGNASEGDYKKKRIESAYGVKLQKTSKISQYKTNGLKNKN